jgi:hypothetical protein
VPSKSKTAIQDFAALVVAALVVAVLAELVGNYFPVNTLY